MLHENTMDKTDPPTTWGIFKPTHHTLIAFADQEALNDARHALTNLGFATDALLQYSAAEMQVIAAAELQNPSPISTFGYELDLLRVHKDLAELGHPFLLVHAPEEAQENLVAELVAQLKPVSAQHYGRFLIRDLTEKSLG